VFVSKFLNTNETMKIQECKNSLNQINKYIHTTRNANILKANSIVFDISKYLDKNWEKYTDKKYYFIVNNNTKVLFTYSATNFTFDCDTKIDFCNKVSN
jgi:hypothetical protein